MIVWVVEHQLATGHAWELIAIFASKDRAEDFEELLEQSAESTRLVFRVREFEVG